MNINSYTIIPLYSPHAHATSHSETAPNPPNSPSPLFHKPASDNSPSTYTPSLSSPQQPYPSNHIPSLSPHPSINATHTPFHYQSLSSVYIPVIRRRRFVSSSCNMLIKKSSCPIMLSSYIQCDAIIMLEAAILELLMVNRLASFILPYESQSPYHFLLPVLAICLKIITLMAA